MATYVRQAVVIVHGMGEQRPLETLTGFIDSALAPDPEGHRLYYSRPESVTGSFESRRFLAPRSPRFPEEPERHAHTEFFEYHWSHLMQGNRLDDLWPTFRRMLLLPPTRVPHGLKGFWLLSWVAIVAAAWAFVWGPWSGVVGEGDLLPKIIATFVSGGLLAALISYVFARILPGWLTSSFVDVTRYLDTSPRSYGARRDIREGFVTLLQGLHESGKYDRIVLVAHSLGAFIAYDGISHLWGLMNGKHAGSHSPEVLGGLAELERAASDLPDPAITQGGSASGPQLVSAFQEAQRGLWRGLRAQGNGWLISDFVSVGTPMYFADQLLAGRGATSFSRRIARRELPTCPPQNEENPANNINGTTRFYSWPKANFEGGRRVERRVIYEGAPFAVVRWTNLYFPVSRGFFGDWFGGPLAPLFGNGIRDVPVTGNGPSARDATWWRNRHVPAAAHAYYFEFPEDDTPSSVTTHLREALGLASSTWVPPRP